MLTRQTVACTIPAHVGPRRECPSPCPVGDADPMNRGTRMSDERALSDLLSAVAADWDLTHFSRRRFMKLAGTAGGLAVGSSTLAWLIEACGGSRTAATNTTPTLAMAVLQ